MKLKAVILDDNPQDIQLLESDLKSEGIQIVKRFTEPFEFLKEANAGLSYDVLFLDMNMPGLLGTDIIPKISKPCILVTGESNNNGEILASLNLEIDNFICTIPKPSKKSHLTKAISLLKESLRITDKLQLVSNGQRVILDTKEIEIITTNELHLIKDSNDETQNKLEINGNNKGKGKGDSKVIYRKSKTPLFISSLTLEEVINRLDPLKFIQTSRYDIINIDQIESFSHDLVTISYTKPNLQTSFVDRPLNKEGRTRIESLLK